MMLDVNERAFFALVRAGLWGNRVQLDSYREVDFGEVDWKAVDWREVYRLADRQLVAGLVAAGLEILGAMMEGVERAEESEGAGAFVVPHAVAKAFAGATMRLERRSEAMDALVGELISELRAAGIEALLVKGQGIALCYERPLWRACGDVDLYLDGAQFERAKELFRPRAEKFDCSLPGHVNMHLGHWTVELHADQHCGISPRINRVMDEIHARLFRAGEAAAAAAVAAACAPEAPETSALGAQESMAQELAARVELAQDNVAQELAARGSGTRMLGEVRMAEIGGVPVALPSPDNDVLIVFVHFINHFYREGLGIRQVCDWCRLLWTYRDTIDKDLLERRLRRMGLVGAWRAFGAFAVTHLGMPAAAMPLSAPRQPRQTTRLASSPAAPTPRSRRALDRQAARIAARLLAVGNFGHNRPSLTAKFSSGPSSGPVSSSAPAATSAPASPEVSAPAGALSPRADLARKSASLLRKLGDAFRLARIFPLDTPRFFAGSVFYGLRTLLKK